MTSEIYKVCITKCKLHFVKMRSTPFLILACLFVGCKSIDQNTFSSSANPQPLMEAKHHFQAGELFQARKITEDVLQKNAGDLEALKLMLDILDAERDRQRKAFRPKALEELEPKEKNSEIKTWLERARLLLQLHQYDEALSAVESVFLYDSQNAEASHLADQIAKEALAEGRTAMLVDRGGVQDQIHSRIDRYREQAHKAMTRTKWGAAKLAVQKMLILSPEDEDALQLQKRIRDHEERKTI